jgi:hypothetical protein
MTTWRIKDLHQCAANFTGHIENRAKDIYLRQAPPQQAPFLIASGGPTGGVASAVDYLLGGASFRALVEVIRRSGDGLEICRDSIFSAAQC